MKNLSSLDNSGKLVAKNGDTEKRQLRPRLGTVGAGPPRKVGKSHIGSKPKIVSQAKTVTAVESEQKSIIRSKTNENLMRQGTVSSNSQHKTVNTKILVEQLAAPSENPCFSDVLLEIERNKTDMNRKYQRRVTVHADAQNKLVDGKIKVDQHDAEVKENFSSHRSDAKKRQRRGTVHCAPKQKSDNVKNLNKAPMIEQTKTNSIVNDGAGSSCIRKDTRSTQPIKSILKKTQIQDEKLIEEDLSNCTIEVINTPENINTKPHIIAKLISSVIFARPVGSGGVVISCLKGCCFLKTFPSYERMRLVMERHFREKHPGDDSWSGFCCQCKLFVRPQTNSWTLMNEVEHIIDAHTNSIQPSSQTHKV